METTKVSTYRPSKKVIIQQRDVDIFGFLDRVGYATVAQIADFFLGSDEKFQLALLRRLQVLRKFGYVKSYCTHRGVYFALGLKGKLDNALITNIKLDQLQHHDFLTELYLECLRQGVTNLSSERECIAEFKVVGKLGKVPDMIINDWIIEFERTSKSVKDSRAVADYWLYSKARHLCVIYDTEEIRNRYSAFLNRDRFILLCKSDYKSILSHLKPINEDDLNILALVKQKGQEHNPVSQAVPHNDVTEPVPVAPTVEATEAVALPVVKKVESKWGDSLEILDRFFTKNK